MNVHVEYRRANQVYEDVLSNVVDLGLVAYPAKDAKLEIVPLRKDPLVLICHPQHPFAKQKTIKLKAARRAEGHRLRAGHPDPQGAGQDLEGTRRGREARRWNSTTSRR